MREGILIANLDKAVNFANQSALAISPMSLTELKKLFKIPKALQELTAVMHPILLMSATYSKWNSTIIKYMIHKPDCFVADLKNFDFTKVHPI